jgi:hypothetical protein
MEAEQILIAIVSAIATDALPPDEAYAWTRIAVHEARQLRAVSDTSAC